jgi:uncharacterized protein (DUF302 family)
MRALEATVAMTLADAERAIREALASQGFGVLTACNPTLANRALDIDSSVALLLPCNVVLDETDGGTRVRVVDPHDLMDDPCFAELADEATNRLQAAVDALGVRAAS